MRGLIRRILTWVGAVAVIYLVVVGCIFLAMTRKKDVPPKTILELDLEHEVIEYQPDDPIAKAAGSERLVLHDLTMTLERAESDPKVVGLVARMGASKLGVATIQEIRDAIVRFRKKGKFALVFSETFGEFANGTGSYYLATGFDEVWMQPSGDVGIAGLYLESPFLRGVLDKVGVKPRLDHRKEYKNAMNMFTEKSMTPAQREAMTKIGDGIYSQMVRAISESRKLTVEEVRATIDKGPLLGSEALTAKFVDKLGYHDEFYAEAKQRAGQGAQLLYLHKYRERAEPLHKKGPRIALIYGVGGVARGKSSFDPLSGDVSMGSDTVAAGFRAAIADKDVKAILFRVSSPGGSYVASDVVWQEVGRARKAGKPVVVSMGNVAGSGGYFVAMAADKIVAEPGTITGSIGVLGGKMVPSELWEKIGLSFEAVQFGKNAGFFSMNRDYTPEEWARLQAWLDRVYEDFTSKVAQGRKLDKQRVLEIAKGRVWTGEDAKGIGLVDELGGLHTALRLCKQLGQIADSQDVELKTYPHDKGALKAMLDKLTHKDPDSSDKEGSAVRMQMQSVDAAQKMIHTARQMGLYGTQEVLQMPLLGDGL